MKYDVAFALVWAEGDEVLNVNEAHAYASCSNCVTVAVAFQVVLIMDDAQVVVPQNLAVAANYECYRCITAALASQLVLSVEETPGEEQLLALGEVWNQLIAFGNSITTYSLTEISAQLDAFKEEIVAILGAAPPVLPAHDTGDTAATGSDADADGGSEPAPTSGPTSGSESSPSSSSETTAPEPASPSPTSAPPEPTTSPSAEEPTPAEATQPAP